MTNMTQTLTRPAVHAGPPKLSPTQLRAAQIETLETPRLKYGLLARLLFKQMDLVYGRERTLVKFTMLEFIARVPYQAWERMGYLSLSRRRRRSALAKRVYERIVETREEQDNEQWHLLILQDLVQREGMRQSFLLHRLAPWLVAFFYYHVSWLLFLVRPELSYRLNADFEDHAEHEYMAYVAEHPELEYAPAPATYAAEYGEYASVADLLRQIGHDERVHKLDSLVNMAAPRFHEAPGR
ncbi:alternative oxidase [Actinomadura sp. 7K534]|uniref:alternative oxidase n=1 Tax=Actinomadura sp. 7K534 TaxID=2530366 RepID=UPI0014050ECF|nr:alternative oxidase [Actinomadura sp. 7K534]